MDAQPTALVGLSGTLHSQFSDWLQRRKPQEEKMLRAYQDNMRISRDDDTKESGMSKAQKSRVFVGSTRGKIRSARAKIKDSLFGANMFPFDTKPTNEQLKDFSDTVEEIITYQLEEGHFKKMLGQGVGSLGIYGTGFIFGPFVKPMTYESVEPTPQGLKETVYRWDCPYYEHARTMDVYPDPEAEDVRQGMGVYWASRKQPDFIRSLKGEPGYDDSAIDAALNEKITAFTDQGSDRTDAARMNLYRYTREGRIWFTRFFGKVKKSELAQWKNPSASSSDDKEMVEAIVIMAGGRVIKAEENPYKNQKRPARRCVYEDVEHEMWGVGIAENNDPHQRVTNAAFRLFIEGKAYALLKMCSIDRSKYEVSEDFKFFPGKRFQMKPGLTPDERKSAMIWHDTPDVTAGWESLIALSEKFSDDDTGITKYTQGDDASHLNDTATGISMIMNASSLPLKEVLSNIDEMWIESMIEDLIDWNMEHLEPETVQRILGDKQAEIWKQIKDYGKTNFMQWFATGSQTFMAKEVLMHKLQGFLQIVLGSEAALQKVDLTELLQQIWDAGQIGKESPILSEEELQKQQQNPANQQAMQHIQEIEQQATKIIQQAKEQAQAAQQQAAQAKQMEEYRLADLAAREREAERKHELAKMAILERIKDAGVDAHLTEAQIDKLQAETVAILAQAGAAASPELQEEAVTKEGDDMDAVGEGAKPDPIESLTKMHSELLAKHGETIDALKRSAGPRRRTMSVVNGQKTVLDVPVESE